VKAEVVFAAMRGKMSTSEIAKKYGVQPMQVWLWKKIAEEELHTLYGMTPEKERMKKLQEKVDSLHSMLEAREKELELLKQDVES
jgi:transposase-like protein